MRVRRKMVYLELRESTEKISSSKRGAESRQKPGKTKNLKSGTFESEKKKYYWPRCT